MRFALAGCRREARVLCFAVLLSASVWALALGVRSSAAWATPPVVPAYGEVGTGIGGFDEAATYGSSTTSGLTAGKFVYPVSMVVDATDPHAKENYAIYVLDLLNPQALNTLHGSPEPIEELSLDYRIQKLGVEGEVLASTSFTLVSTSATPGLHATSLAVDGATDKVYAMIADLPVTEDNEHAGAVAAYAIKAWSAGRETGDTALAALPQLAGPTTLQPGGQATPSTLAGDVRPEALLVDDSEVGKPGEETSVAVAGEQYGEAAALTPVIERVSTSGAQIGSVEASKWGSTADIEATEAKAGGAESSSLIYAGSTNPDGSLNVVLGPNEAAEAGSDEEPNMATISGDLEHTAAILPWEGANEGGGLNRDRTATTFFHQELSAQLHRRITGIGGSTLGGTLAPSVVQLAGEGQVASGVYAGVVAQEPIPVDPQSNKPPSWIFGADTKLEEEPFEVTSVKSASLAIRLFDPQGESLGMIGNVTAGGHCNLQGGSYGEDGSYHGSFVALAPGRDGALFALVQPDLDENIPLFHAAPGAPIGKVVPEGPLTNVQGDRVLEFAPGAGQQCPQPSGSFSMTQETPKPLAPSTGTGPITIPVGAKLKLESEVDLQGGAPWAYEWKSGEGASITNKWLPANEWKWPSDFAEFTYSKAGTYLAELSLVNDFGTLKAQRTVNVIEATPPTACLESAGGTVGQAVAFDASCSKTSAGDSIVAYRWNFGDGHGETTSTPKTQHFYSTAGTRSVSLTITDALSQEASASKSVVIGGGTTTTTSTTPTTTPTTTTTTTTPTEKTVVIDTSPTEVNPKIATTATIHGTVAVGVSCPAAKPACSGTITLKTIAGKASSSGHGKRSSSVVIARASFSLHSGQSETVQLHISSKGLGLLRAKHSLKVVATITATDPAGHKKTITKVITLRAATKAHKKR